MKKHERKHLVKRHRFERAFKAALELLADAAHGQLHEKTRAHNVLWVTVGQLAFGAVVFDDFGFVVEQNRANRQVVKSGLRQAVKGIHNVATVHLKKLLVLLK